MGKGSPKRDIVMECLKQLTKDGPIKADALARALHLERAHAHAWLCHLKTVGLAERVGQRPSLWKLTDAHSQSDSKGK